MFLLFFAQDLRELWPGFHVRHCQRSCDVEHLDRDAEWVLLCHSQAEEDCYLLRPRGLRLRPESAERCHVIVLHLPTGQKNKSKNICFHSTLHQMQDTQPFLPFYKIYMWWTIPIIKFLSVMQTGGEWNINLRVRQEQLTVSIDRDVEEQIFPYWDPGQWNLFWAPTLIAVKC